MRRALIALAGGLALVGAEVGAGTVTLTVHRFVAGARAILSGGQAGPAAPRVLGGWTLLLLAAVLVGTALWAGRVAERVHAERRCPRCGVDTKRIRRRRRHRVLARLLEQGLTHRACGKCGWTGLAARG